MSRELGSTDTSILSHAFIRPTLHADHLDNVVRKNVLAYRFGPNSRVADSLRPSPKLSAEVSAFIGKELIFRAGLGSLPSERRTDSQSRQAEGWTSELQIP